jgi:hypothetical protein
LSKPLVMPDTAHSRHIDYRISMYQPKATSKRTADDEKLFDIQGTSSLRVQRTVASGRPRIAAIRGIGGGQPRGGVQSLARASPSWKRLRITAMGSIG